LPEAALTTINTIENPDLSVTDDNKPHWNMPDNRRHGFHNIHRLARYSLSLRARRVMTLSRRIDLRIGDLESVRRFSQRTAFSALVVIRGQHVLHEAYAADFGPDQPHSIQSMNKTVMNLIVGRLVEDGQINLNGRVRDYLPDIGSGYAEATIQQVLDMNVINNFSEDFTDPTSPYWSYEPSMGWRLPQGDGPERTIKEFVAEVESEDVTNTDGFIHYKDTNTDVLAWIAEVVSGRSMRAMLSEIADAAGLAGNFHTSCDREGFPCLSGGASLTARDMARYGALFVRGGMGVDGNQVGSAPFIEATPGRGVPQPPPRDHLRYSNQTNTNGRWIGHGGYGGQYMLCDPESGVVGVAYSVIEDKDGYPRDYFPPVIAMLEEIALLPFND
jgi:CubicO group peptidase (beta-lactamase class C family)